MESTEKEIEEKRYLRKLSNAYRDGLIFLHELIELSFEYGRECELKKALDQARKDKKVIDKLEGLVKQILP